MVLRDRAETETDIANELDSEEDGDTEDEGHCNDEEEAVPVAVETVFCEEDLKTGCDED